MAASTTSLTALPWRRRIPWIGSVGLVAALSVGTSGADSWPVGVLAVATSLFAVGRATTEGRVVGWGLAMVIASLGAGADDHTLRACSAIGLLAGGVAARWALTKMPAEGGMVRVRPSSPVPAVALVSLAWWACVMAEVGPTGHAVSLLVEHPAAWTTIALLVGATFLALPAERTLRARALEIGAIERAGSIRAVMVTLPIVGLLVTTVGDLAGEGVARLGLATGQVLVTAAAIEPDAVRVAQVGRRSVLLVVVGGAVALVAAALMEGPGRGWQVAMIAVGVAIAVGASAVRLEAPLRPAGGAWLDAFATATEAAVGADPEEALRAALLALRAPAGLDSPSPELWSFSPGSVCTVDAAGYLHEREGRLPEALVSVAAAEPEATARADVLDALEVRRPELRPLAAWMTERGVMLATVVACEGEVEGLLVVPRGRRQEPISFEEVRALKRLADRLALASRGRATRARVLGKEREASARVEQAELAVERIRHRLTLEAGRDTLAALRLARPATVGAYSAASRMALEALELRTAAGIPIAVVAPAGVDPVPLLAHAHLTGARAGAPLVLVDATILREHDASRWRDPRSSPLALADRGMLVLLDGGALPADVQRLIARVCAEKRAPWERPDPLDFQLALTGVSDPQTLVDEGRLHPALAARLGDARAATVVLPRLRDRPDDLRAIMTDRLAREGLRQLGRPVGIEHSAFARLAEYPFPGEDAELSAIVRRLVARCRNDVVRAADVEALALPAEEANDRKDPLTA